MAGTEANSLRDRPDRVFFKLAEILDGGPHVQGGVTDNQEDAMKASRHSRIIVAVAVLAMCASLAPVKGARAEAKKKAKAPSLSKVLDDADGKLGKSYVSIGNGYGMPETDPGEDKTLAPFFYVADGDPELDALPLKKTSAEVKIAGVIANVRVSQTFENEGKKPIEAIYVFPASTRAAVHAMRMKIGERIVEAKIEEREEAKQQYEAAKNEGKKASLLEQQRPNVFTMNVANIMPGDSIDVELDYSELLVPTDSMYEFVYPTVVGPRYGNGADEKKDGWIGNPYLSEGKKETYGFDILVALETGIPIKEIKCPSHEVDVSFTSDSVARVSLDQEGGGNKDFILRYRLAGDEIESGVLTYDSGGESFFVVMMEPPERPDESQIPPREYIFVLDVSGSMYGFPLDTAKSLMKKLLSSLREDDLFNVVLFAGASYRMDEKSLKATDKNIDKAIGIIDKQQGGGGTELMDGLRTAYGIDKAGESVSRTIVVVTDGYVGVEAQAFKFIRNNLSDANLFAFGIGSSVNRALIEGMAKAGMGEPFVVLNPEAAPKEAETFRKYIESPVLTDIEVKFDGFKATDVLPEHVPDLLARRPIVLIGKYEGDLSGKVQVSGVSGDGKFTKSMKVDDASSSERTAPLRHLWARTWVELLEDQTAMLPGDEELAEAITALGLEYSLLTSCTSFVAIDSEVTNTTGQSSSVKQPLPLPEGVSNYAVGGMAMQSAGPMPGMMPMAPSPTGGSPKYKKGGWDKSSKATETSAPDMDELEESPAPSDKKEKDKDKSGSVKLTFGTDPAGSKVKLHQRKNIEWLIEDALDSKLDSGDISCGSSLSVTIVLELDSNGSVKAVKVTGASSAVAKAIKAKLASLSGLKGLSSITVSAVFSCSN